MPKNFYLFWYNSVILKLTFEEKPMNAILIARVSTEEQKNAGNSLPAQVARLERYCQNKNFTIIKTCSFDESAYTNDRSEFDRIIDFILNHKEKIAVCCDKVDRLSRNMFDNAFRCFMNRFR